jgi:hypothetical protein
MQQFKWCVFYGVGFHSEETENSILWSICFNMCQVVYLHSHNRCILPSLPNNLNILPKLMYPHPNQN